ncbi:MAG: response regulator transcription factor [Bacteroidia bacterium]|nr:response regulator transcription factor [Bacteroidia bacterium]
MIKIMLIDSHEPYLEAVSELIGRQKDMATCHKLTSAAKAVEILRNENAEKPDVVLIDADLKEKEPVGLSYATYITHNFPSIAVIVQSMQKVAIYPHKMEESDVAGFLFKDCNNKELLTAIRVVASGKKFYQREVKDVLKRYRQYLDAPDDNEPFLTRTEKSILQWMSWGFSDDSISEKMQICQKAFALHWNNISRKFGTVNLGDILRESIERGFLDTSSSAYSYAKATRVQHFY